MVLTSKWGRILPEIQIWPDQIVAASWTLVRSSWKWEKMFIQLISATGPSSPAVHWRLFIRKKKIVADFNAWVVCFWASINVKWINGGPWHQLLTFLPQNCPGCQVSTAWEESPLNKCDLSRMVTAVAAVVPGRGWDKLCESSWNFTF